MVRYQFRRSGRVVEWWATARSYRFEVHAMQALKCLTIGWEPEFIACLLAPIEQRTGIEFTHGLVGDASRLPHVRRLYPSTRFVSLSKTGSQTLPAPDYELLARLESAGVPTVRCMVRGDRVLRHRTDAEALGYATLIAQRLHAVIDEAQPDFVLGTYDSLHAAVGLAVAKAHRVPWVAMAFPVIPDDLTGFCKGLTPESLVRMGRAVDEQLLARAREIITSVRSRRQRVVAFRAPTTVAQWVRQYLVHGANLLRRERQFGAIGIDRYTFPLRRERLADILRRTFNRIRLPTDRMLRTPPRSRFVYYPFHMAPESMVDTWAPFYQDQLAFVRQLALAIPADTEFVVKLHFSDPDNYSLAELTGLMRATRLSIAHPNAPGNAFIEESALVVGIQGTSCLEAALLGKAVLLFGDSPYLHFPRTERARRPDELHEQIVQILNRPPASDDDIAIAFAAYMARYMPGRVNDWSRPVEDDEMARYCECFMALGKFLQLPVNREEWYLDGPFADASRRCSK